MFLLGAGASRPGGFPTTEELTQLVLSGTGVILHTDSTHYLSSDEEEARTSNNAAKVQESVRLLNTVRAECDRYYPPDSHRITNYEDLYFMCRQVYECVSHELDNPGIQPFVEKLADVIEVVTRRSIAETSRTGAVADLAVRTTEYIHDVVWRRLASAPSRTDHLQFVVDTSAELGPDRISVTTLNHDRSIDLVLHNAGIAVTDGFGVAVNEIRYLCSGGLRRRGNAIPLIKLHGEVSWFEFERRAGEFGLSRIGSYSGVDYQHTLNEKGELQWPLSWRPMLLIGTTNKITQYHDRGFVDLQYAFLEELRRTQTVVCAGYGFGDKGINRRILEWLFDAPDRCAIVLHGDSLRLRERARPAIARYWDGLQAAGRLKIVPKWVGDATWDDVRRAMS